MLSTTVAKIQVCFLGRCLNNFAIAISIAIAIVIAIVIAIAQQKWQVPNDCQTPQKNKIHKIFFLSQTFEKYVKASTSKIICYFRKMAQVPK